MYVCMYIYIYIYISLPALDTGSAGIRAETRQIVESDGDSGDP